MQSPIRRLPSGAILVDVAELEPAQGAGQPAPARSIRWASAAAGNSPAWAGDAVRRR
jgi:hypothetical protein